MKLSILINKVRSVTKEEDPEIRIVGEGGFLDIDEILSRKDYYDDSFFTGKEFEKGNFACIEVAR